MCRRPGCVEHVCGWPDQVLIHRPDGQGFVPVLHGAPYRLTNRRIEDVAMTDSMCGTLYKSFVYRVHRRGGFYPFFGPAVWEARYGDFVVRLVCASV